MPAWSRVESELDEGMLRDVRDAVFKVGACSLKSFTLMNEDEIRRVLAWRNRPRTRLWMVRNKPISMDEHREFLRHLSEGTSDLYWMILKGRLRMGVIYLNQIDRRERSARIGLYRNPDYRRAGVGSEMMGLLLETAFDRLGLEILYAMVLEHNQRAVDLYVSAGFRPTGRVVTCPEEEGERRIFLEMRLTGKGETT